MGKFTDLLKDLDINEEHTKTVKKEKVFTKVRDNICLIKGNNQQMDVLYLPTAQFGYRYLLVCVDLATNQFDIEPMKDLYPVTILNSYKNMFGRGYIDRATTTMATDGGSEFKGVFAAYLKEHQIFHRVSIPDRHTQQANVESLNRTLGRLINGYLNSKERKTGVVQKNWIGSLDKIRNKLNKIRYTKPPDNVNSFVQPFFNPIESKKVTLKNGKLKRVETIINPKFKKGDLVYYRSEVPLNALGKKQPTKNNREGDTKWVLKPQKIIDVLNYGGLVHYRYLLENVPRVSYTENQLKLAKLITT